MTAVKPALQLKRARQRRFAERAKGTDRKCSKCSRIYRPGHIAYCHSCYLAYKRDWYKRNSAAERRRMKEYQQRRPEVFRDHMRRKRDLQPELTRAQTRKWRQANKERVALMDANKRARRRARKTGRVTFAEWESLKELWGHRCAFCGRFQIKLTQDHSMPLNRGGIHDISNLLPACRSCNSQKCDKTAEEYVAWLATRYSQNLNC